MAQVKVNLRKGADTGSLLPGDIVVHGDVAYLIAGTAGEKLAVCLLNGDVEPITVLDEWMNQDPYKAYGHGPIITRLNRGESVTLTQE